VTPLLLLRRRYRFVASPFPDGCYFATAVSRHADMGNDDMNMNRLMTGAGLGLALLAAAPLSAQKAEIVSGPLKLGFTGRLQFQFNTTSVDAQEAGTDVEPAANTFETRRIRAAVELTLADWIGGMIETDVAMGRLQVRQAWIDLGFSDAFALKAGQYKKPFSLIQLTSSSKIPMIERNVRIRDLADAIETADADGVLSKFHGAALLGEEQLLLETLGYDSYDMGASLHGKIGSFGYEAGLFNGTGSDKADENGVKSFASRVTYRLPTTTYLTVGAEASVRDYLVGPETKKGTALGADLEWGEYKKPGVWLMAEGTMGDNLVGGDFRAAQAVATYYIPTNGRVEGVAPVFRVSWGDPDQDVADDAGLLLTPGLNLHFFTRNQLMFNWDWYLPQGDAFSKQHAFRAQVQLYY